MNKGFKITIVDNNTGDVLVDYENANAIVGAIAVNGGTHSIGFTRCNSITLAATIGGCQKVVASFIEENPGLDIIGQMIAAVENLDGGDNDDE